MSFISARPGAERSARMPRRRFLSVIGTALAWGVVVTEGVQHGLPASLFPPYAPRLYPNYLADTAPGWYKYDRNPVLGGNLGTCFDVCVLRDGSHFRMWFSWRPKQSIGYTESVDGIHWSPPEIVLSPALGSGWQNLVNRPAVLKNASGYHMWFTGQTDSSSAIGYARSDDGVQWRREGRPVLTAGLEWEKVAVMAPSVLWDSVRRRYRMWYSGGDQFEPDAIGYAESPDGLHWDKHASGPSLRPAGGDAWDRQRVTAPQVVRQDDWYLMFYIGFYNEMSAEIGLARSRDGVSHWQRYPANPILRPAHDRASWDYDAVYRPWAVQTERGWMLWYNGRRGNVEQIGLAYHPGSRLWS